MKHPTEPFREWKAHAITWGNFLRQALERGAWMCPADESYEWVDSEILEAAAFYKHQDPSRGTMLLAFSHCDGRDAYEQAQGWEDASFTSQNLYDIFTIPLDGVDAVCLDFGMEYEVVIPKEDFPELKKLAEAIKVELAWQRLRDGEEWDGDLRRVALYEGYHVAVAKIGEDKCEFCAIRNTDGSTFIALFTHDDARDLGWPEIQDRYEGCEPNTAAVSGPQIFPSFISEDTSGMVVNPHGPTTPVVFTGEVFELLSAEIDRAYTTGPEGTDDTVPQTQA